MAYGILYPNMMGAGQGLLSPQAPGAQQTQMLGAQMPQEAGLLARFMPGAAESPFYQAFDRGRGALSDALLGMVGQDSAKDAMRGAAQGAMFGSQMDQKRAAEREQKAEIARQRNRTIELLTSQRPDLVPWIEAGAITPADAFNQVFGKPASGTDDIKEYQYAVEQGYKGTFRDYMTEMKKAGATTVDARQMGTIPPGYQVEYDENGRPLRMAAIPGGPAALDQDAAAVKENARKGMSQITSDTVIETAKKARDAVRGSVLPTTGTLGNWAANISETGAAEVRRQVDSLKAVAASENINAMRQASPTGGALGNASDADIKLLKDKAGALDPGSPNFLRDLDDYERTLLRIVHGPAAGDAIFQQSRQAGGDLKQKYGLD